MWGASEEPPGTMEGEPPPEPVIHAKEKCEQNKNQLESLKEIMLRNKQSLKKKEEEVQEYARRLSKIKSRAKLSHRSKEGSHSKDTSQLPKSDAVLTDVTEDTVDDVSQAKTPKAKLLQKKLAENRKAFEQRSKEITESKRAVEEKVEAIRQQLEENDVAAMGLHKDQLPVTPIRPVVVTSDVMSPIQIANIQEKENKIIELNNRILELEANVIDLQENLKEKDSVIESKTKAVTLMSADLSKKGKTTLDSLEDTKDEMRMMQEHFVLLETSLKNKNENLLGQLEERDNRITELEGIINRFEEQMNEQKLAESASVDFSRTTMDTLVETKDAMKSMQENFVLIESSLKAKNDNLLEQMKEYEIKLAEANERVFQLESGIGIVKEPAIDDLQFKLDKLEQSNKSLQDEKYELQKSIAEMQDKIVNRSVHGNGAIMEKDNRIAELENLVEELKQSNKLLEEESKTELQKQLADLTLRNEEYSNKITDLETMVHELEAQKNDIAARLPDENAAAKENEKIAKLTKELEESNKTLIKIKAQHRSKVKNLQKQLENFKMVSDTNAELVRLGNQVALLEEEKGNLQLSLVDFDELKASAGDWQERIADLETKVSAQTKEIQMHIEAIAILENQKLDLMQDLHAAKQEVSALEAENAESENLRVTAEMKVVDLEEQLESMHKMEGVDNLETLQQTSYADLLKRIEVLTQENSELFSKVAKMEEKGTSDTGSTESFEAIHEADKTDLLKKIEDLTQKNNELTLKLTRLEEKGNSQAGSTESFETINDTDKTELLKKIDQLTQENTDLTMKLSRIEEKGSSDTGSTESFERIPEHSDSSTKMELLIQENSELVIKLTKLEEQLRDSAESGHLDSSKSDCDAKMQVENLLQETNEQSLELTKLRAQIMNIEEENQNLHKRIETLMLENNAFSDTHGKLEDRIVQLEAEVSDDHVRSKRGTDNKEEMNVLMEEKEQLEKEVNKLRQALEDSHSAMSQETETRDLKSRIEELLRENDHILGKVAELEKYNEKLKEDLSVVAHEKEVLRAKIDDNLSADSARERLELIDKLEKLNQEKESVAQERQELHEQISTLLHRSNEELSETRKSDDSMSQQTETMIVATLEKEIEECKKLIAEQSGLIEEMKIKLTTKEKELEEKGKQIMEYEASGKKTESLENELKEMLNTIEEWKYKCNEMQEKMQVLEAGKASIEEGFMMLQSKNEALLEEKKENEVASNSLKQQLEGTIALLESKLQEEVAAVAEKDEEIRSLKDTIEAKDQELHAKYTQLQNEMIAIDSLQDELTNCKALLEEKETSLTRLSEEVANLNNVLKNKEDEIYSLRRDVFESNEKMKESKPLDEYNELVEHIKNRDMILAELQGRINVTAQDNHHLSEKISHLTQQNDELQAQLTEKHQELTDIMKTKEHLDAQVTELTNDKTEAERRIWELQGIIENNSKFVEELQVELKNGYRHMEQLKMKHTEDTELQNQRVESLIEDLNAKTQECETLKDELQEKERLVSQDMTEEAKLALEEKIADLEKKLSDADDRIRSQLEKMKKIAANLKKKTAICQELEARVAELEEKWTTEKDEKEAKNKRIQEVEIAIREKDNKITDLEERLVQAKNETMASLQNIDTLTNDLARSKEKMSILTQQITEMEEEIVKLRENLESSTAELTAERTAKEGVMAQFESYRQEIIEENERKQVEMDDVKERARELSVRMQVLEMEYVEQLASIKNLQAENGLLLSKQAQINEKLENVEKESEDRRLLIEQLQKQIVDTTTVSTQTTEDLVEDETRLPGVQHCSHCEQCQTLVQALEAKLQEREAEIDNLDNELANSIGNFVQMRESLRANDLMNQTGMRNRSLEDSYNDILFQYNALNAAHEELKAKLNHVLEENKELAEKIETLQTANVTLEEKVNATERTLTESTDNERELQIVELSKKCEDQEADLLKVQQEMQLLQERADELQKQLGSQANLFETEREQLLDREKQLTDAKNSLEEEIESLKVDMNSTLKRIGDLENELEAHKQHNVETTEHARIVKREAPVFEEVADGQQNAPQLFDASKIFGSTFAPESDILNSNEITKLQQLLDKKEAQCLNLTQEIDHLQRLMIEERSSMAENYSKCSDELKISQNQVSMARAEVERLEHLMIEKNKQIDELTVELNNVSLQVMAQHDHQNYTDHKLKDLTVDKDNQIAELRAELNSTRESLDAIVDERDQQNQLLESYKFQISNLDAELRNSTDPELIQELETRISSTIKERDLLQLQLNDLTRAMDELKHSTDIDRNLQLEIERAVHERDEARNIIANLTQELEAARASSKEHVTVESSTMEPVQEAITTQSVDEGVQQGAQGWDPEKLNDDEETWGWNADDVQLTDDQQYTTLTPNMEVQLRAKIDDLQDRLKDVEAERDRIVEENKAAQIRSGKMIKKLKEYKVQMESLQQQLKIQKSASDFCLDSAIEEELKSQISLLEKTLSQAREEQKAIAAEKEALLKRLSVVLPVNENYKEMKEKQDIEMEVLRIRNKELSEKIEILNRQLQENATNVGGSEVAQSDTPGETAKEDEVKQTHGQPSDKSAEEEYQKLYLMYKSQVDDLKDEMEALADENELLQHTLEKQSDQLSDLEAKRTADENMSLQIVDELNQRISELQGMLSKSKEEYSLLRKQYEQSLMDANDQVSIMRQNTDILQTEAIDKTNELERKLSYLRQELEESDSRENELKKKLEDVLMEKGKLEEKLTDLMTSSEKQLSAVSSSMAEVTDLLNTRIQEVADLKQELQRQYIDHEEAKTNLQQSIQELTRELGEKKQQLDNLSQSFSDKERELIQQQSVETVSALVSQATQELVQKHAIEMEEKDKELRGMNEKLLSLQSSLDNYSLDIQNSIVRSNAQEQELQLLKQALTEKDSHLESLQSDLHSMKEEMSTKQAELSLYENNLQKLTLENQNYAGRVDELQKRLNDSETSSIGLQDYVERIQNLEQELVAARTTLVDKESIFARYDEESKERTAQLESYQSEIQQLRAELENISTLRNEIREQCDKINGLNTELESARQSLNEKDRELEKLSITLQDSQHYSSSNIVDGLPLFKMGGESPNLQGTVDLLQTELERKQEEIEHLKYVLNENTYPSMIQEMQDRINCLYNEKAELETSLEVASKKVLEKEKEVDDLAQQIKVQSQEILSKEESHNLSRERRSVHDQEEIVGLQNELHAKEQEINELKYVIAEKDSQLALQASMGPESDDFELRGMVDRLTAELYGKEQEIQHLKSTIAELQKEVARLQEVERLSEQSKEAIQRLSFENEQVRQQAQEFLERQMRHKEMEIDELKQRLAAENQRVLDEMQLKNNDIENLSRQLREVSTSEQGINEKFRRKEEELLAVGTDLAEKERRLAELSITKDAELHNLKVQIQEKELRIEELQALSEEEEKQLVELKNLLEARETEINSLKKLLETKVKEYEVIENALKKDVPIIDAAVSSEAAGTEVKESASQELDLALYMLHQRDVRCEELTHELMQLLEERDTLQLRLSNAIRVNEELRRAGPDPPKEVASDTDEPLVEHPSPSKSEGPVEIAKEAIDAPIGEDKEALALKLSQLHTVSHTKDVRLRDERELRHTQQMSLLAHKDVLSTLPPEAAARLVNANYTLSRDVQSQSSVLLNWLWGKSTPKVVHM